MEKQSKHTKLITMRLLKGLLTYEQARDALDNPEKFKAEEKRKSLLKNRADGQAWPGRYRWAGKIRTARMNVGYCWMMKRNKAGYFLGWRETYDTKGALIERDQFVARKSKKRLSLLQKRRTEALKSKKSVAT
jgi:hypothetical protein